MSQNLEASQKTFERAITVQEQALRASYLVSYRLAKSKKAHTVAEVAIDMCTALIGEKEAATLKTIPLSNDTVHMRICDMSNDVSALVTFSPYNSMKPQTWLAVPFSWFNVRYVRNDDFEEQFLFNADLPTSTTAVEIFSAMDTYFNSVSSPGQSVLV